MTKSGRATTVLAFLGLLMVAVSLPLLATDEGGDPEPAVQTTIVTTDIEPAVQITVPPEATTTPDWTYRYLVPTGIALAILVILATSGQYFTNVVRKRYRIVEE